MIGVILWGYAFFVGEEIPFRRPSSSNRDLDFESGRGVSNADTPAVVLQEIAMKCGTKVKLERDL
jgi:RNA polymerase II C-terminal domain phosphatase-like 1/2